MYDRIAVQHLQALADAVDDWHDWAHGKPMPVERIAHLEVVLGSDRDVYRGASQALTTAVDEWAQTQGIRLHPARPSIPPTPSIDIEVDF